MEPTGQAPVPVGAGLAGAGLDGAGLCTAGEGEAAGDGLGPARDQCQDFVSAKARLTGLAGAMIGLQGADRPLRNIFIGHCCCRHHLKPDQEAQKASWRQIAPRGPQATGWPKGQCGLSHMVTILPPPLAASLASEQGKQGPLSMGRDVMKLTW